MKTIKDIAVSNPTPWGDLAQAIDENFNELYLDAPHKDIQELLDISFDIYDYEIRDNSQGEPNWIKFLIGIPEVKNGKKTGKNLAYEFHGNYQSLIKYLKACEEVFTKDGILPLKGVEIENQCGYIFKGSTNQITYIQEQ